MLGTYNVGEQNGIWYVFEEGTPIAKSKDLATAQLFAQNLELGHGFGGKTPQFLANSGPIDLDKK